MTENSALLDGLTARIEALSPRLLARAHTMLASLSDGPGATELTAFVVSDSATESEIRSSLVDRLPLSMIPARIVRVPQIPRTAGGKVDRTRLRLPATPEPAAAAPRTAGLDRLIERVWRTALGSSPLNGVADFFAAGGTSIVAIRVLSQLRATLSTDLPLSSIFRHPRFDDFAAYVRTCGDDGADLDALALAALATLDDAPGQSAPQIG